MIGRPRFVLGWVALLVSASAHGSSLTVAREKDRYLSLAATFRSVVENQHFSLRLEFGDGGRIVVRQALLGPHSREDLLCEDKPPEGGFDFLAQARFDLYFVEQCLTESQPRRKRCWSPAMPSSWRMRRDSGSPT